MKQARKAQSTSDWS